MVFRLIICSLKMAASSDSHHESLLPLEYWRIKKCTAQNANAIRSHTSASRRDARRGNAGVYAYFARTAAKIKRRSHVATWRAGCPSDFWHVRFRGAANGRKTPHTWRLRIRSSGCRRRAIKPLLDSTCECNAS